MVSKRWAGARRWAAAAGLALLVAVLASACAPSAAKSQPTAKPSDSSTSGPTLTTEAAKNLAVQTWVRHLASLVALDTKTLPDSEAGFQLETDKLAVPITIAEGGKENQYEPTGSVAWVALPSAKPQLAMLAQIKTTWQPKPSTSVQASSENDLVLFTRAGVGEKWRMVADPMLDPSASTTQLNELRQFKGAYPAKSSSSLAIPPSSLPAKYWGYVSGGPTAPFSPGLLTDQRRASLQQTASAAAQTGGSLSLPFEGGSVIGQYAVGGNRDALVLFGTRSAEVTTAPSGRCLVQSSAQPAFPAIVPNGKYAQVRLEFRVVDIALEDKSTGMVTILGDLSTTVGESTTPTTAPECL